MTRARILGFGSIQSVLIIISAFWGDASFALEKVRIQCLLHFENNEKKSLIQELESPFLAKYNYASQVWVLTDPKVCSNAIEQCKKRLKVKTDLIPTLLAREFADGSLYQAVVCKSITVPQCASSLTTETNGFSQTAADVQQAFQKLDSKTGSHTEGDVCLDSLTEMGETELRRKLEKLNESAGQAKKKPEGKEAEVMNLIAEIGKISDESMAIDSELAELRDQKSSKDKEKTKARITELKKKTAELDIKRRELEMQKNKALIEFQSMNLLKAKNRYDVEVALLEARSKREMLEQEQFYDSLKKKGPRVLKRLDGYLSNLPGEKSDLPTLLKEKQALLAGVVQRISNQKNAQSSSEAVREFNEELALFTILEEGARMDLEKYDESVKGTEKLEAQIENVDVALQSDVEPKIAYNKEELKKTKKIFTSSETKELRTTYKNVLFGFELKEAELRHLKSTLIKAERLEEFKREKIKELFLAKQAKLRSMAEQIASQLKNR